MLIGSNRRIMRNVFLNTQAAVYCLFDLGRQLGSAKTFGISGSAPLRFGKVQLPRRNGLIGFSWI